MTSTIKNLNDKITTNLASVTCEKTIGQLAGAIDSLSNATIDCVASTACLPTAANNTGRFVGVGTSSALCYRYSNGIEWRCDYDSTSGVLARQLWVMGQNNVGQLGTGNLTNYSSPVTTAGGGTTWCQVVPSQSVSIGAIKTDGTLWMWGCNAYGMLGTGNTTAYSSPVTTAGGGTTWCTAVIGGCHSAAIKTDGTLWTWGGNTYGQLGTGDNTCRSSPATVIGGGTTWCQVSASGEQYSAAIKTDGTLWTWGRNNSGGLMNGGSSTIYSPVTTAGGGTNWCQISTGNYHTIAIKTDGTLWVGGYNNAGQLGTGNLTNYSSPVTTVAGGTNWCQVSAGGLHSTAIKTDGTLWTWGYNNSGELGTGNTSYYSSPVTTAGGGTTWCKVSGGNASDSSAIKTDGTLWAWGDNTYGQLGTGNTTAYSSPVTTVAGGTNWCQVSVAGARIFAIKQVYKGF